MKKLVLCVSAACMLSGIVFGQTRATDKDGLNVFEVPKTEPAPFDGIKVKIGGAFTQSWQSMKEENSATPVYKWDGAAYEYNTGASYNKTTVIDGVTYSTMVNGAKYTNVNQLVPIKSGFNTANANLYLDVALAEGVNLNMALYLSSRHHNECWVKGGYIQFDKVPFVKSELLDDIMKFTTVKVGHMEVNYGDAHFRRSDNGCSIYNPFVENYIMDEFATEIGAEVDLQHKGFIGVLGITNGEIKGDIGGLSQTPASATANPYPSEGNRHPSVLGKLGYDKQVTDNFRLRASVSAYYNSGAMSSTLFGGDRGGSHYFGVIENALSTSAAFSGRFNPGFNDKIGTGMGNLLLKYKLLDGLSLESFTTYESAKGRAQKETLGERTAKQFATDFVVRMGKSENVWLGARYNTVKSEMAAQSSASTNTWTALPDITINRFAISGGWYMTKNIMAKVEYVNQKYKGFTNGIYDAVTPTKVIVPADIRSGAKFNGVVLEAVVGF
jgi:hypothetical protein